MTLLRVRWLGRVPYREAEDLQRALLEHSADDYLLLLEHPHVYTLGTQADLAHVLVPPATVGAEIVSTDRGGDVTYHGPGQLVGYPIISLPEWRDGRADVVAYVRMLEDVMIATLADFGVGAGRSDRYTGVWVGDEKIGAIGVKVARGRTRHGFALNVDPDMTMFEHIVPCGIRDRGVTSLARLLDEPPAMRAVADAIVRRFADRFGVDTPERQDTVFSRSLAAGRDTRPADARSLASDLRSPSLAPVAARQQEQPVRLLGRLAQAGVDVPEEDPAFRRPQWMRVKADLGPNYRETKRLMRRLDLHTVCEEAGCPNIYECWADKTATFMILGERCTRACGFCLVDTRHPEGLDEEEPARVANAVAELGLAHAVVTSVARDDLDDGGASIFAATIRAIRSRTPLTRVEVLIPDCKGDADALGTIFGARPDVLNHNLETVARLQRAARPSAAYFRSLALLARAKNADLTTKSGIILGMGERADEVRGALADLRGVGVDIVTLGQYLRPSPKHLPLVKWWTPEEFAELGAHAESLGFSHVESGPLVRSSYHARYAVDAVIGDEPLRATGAR